MSDTEHKLIMGEQFVRALIDLGIADNRTRSVHIHATVGEAITLRIVKFGDDRLIQLVEDGIVIAHGEKEAIVR